MLLFKSLFVAISTYSALPVPQFEWDDKNMKYAICWFPAVGLACGAALWGWYALAKQLEISSFFFAVIATCLPLLITGGIHMDGYMDTVDALASHRSREEKLKILKDPHCGAFAVIYCGIYLFAYTGLAYELYTAECILILCPVFVLSRCLSALCAVNMPKARKPGMLCAYTKNTEKQTATMILSAVFLLSAAAVIRTAPLIGGNAVLFAILTTFAYRKLTMKQFGGVTGDTAGFFLQICELSSLFGAWIGGRFV